MRPSELKRGALQLGESGTPKLKFPVDEKAEPPISAEEALAADGATCPRHGGLIGQRGDKEGMVFLCTDCRMYWRYLRNRGPSRVALTYKPRGYI